MKWKKQRRRNASGSSFSLLLVMMTIGPDARLHQLARLVDVELHAVEFEQQVVRKLDVGLVDLVDQQHRLLLATRTPPRAGRG